MSPNEHVCRELFFFVHFGCFYGSFLGKINKDTQTRTTGYGVVLVFSLQRHCSLWDVDFLLEDYVA